MVWIAQSDIEKNKSGGPRLPLLDPDLRQKLQAQVPPQPLSPSSNVQPGLNSEIQKITPLDPGKLFEGQGKVEFELGKDKLEVGWTSDEMKLDLMTDFSGSLTIRGEVKVGPGANRAEVYGRLVIDRTQELFGEISEKFLDKMNSTEDASTAKSRLEMFRNDVSGIVDGSMERLASADQLTKGNLAVLRREVESSLLVAAYQMEKYEELREQVNELREESIREQWARDLIESIAAERNVIIPR